MRNTGLLSHRNRVEKNVCDDKEAMKRGTVALVESIMKEEARQQACAYPYEHSVVRRAHRNGYKKRGLLTRSGPVEVRKPQFREISFETRVFDKFARAEKAIVATIGQNYVSGISTRRMEKTLKEFCIEVSKSAVSRICEDLDVAVEEFMNRKLDVDINYLFIDATYIRVKKDSRFITMPLFIALGVNAEGYKEILGVKLMESENEEFYQEFFQDLKDRGMNGVQMVISDGHKGIKKAVDQMFPGASWQLCHVHFRRNVLKSVPLKQRREVNELLKQCMDTPEQLQECATQLEARGFQKAADMIDRHLNDLFNYRAFPKNRWLKLRTTNSVENLNSNIKRRTRKIGAFPTENSVYRVTVTILLDINDEFLTDKKHIDMERNDEMELQGLN